MSAERSIGRNHPESGDYSRVNWQCWAALDAPLGAHNLGATTTFAVYSKHASAVLLEIYTESLGENAAYDYFLERGSDDVWRAEIAGVPVGALYGFRAWGQNFRFSPGFRRGGSIQGFVTDVDRDGNRFNPNKLLFDPYARELSHDRETPEIKALGHHAEMYGSGPGLYAGFGLPAVARRAFDTGPWAPKSVVVCDRTPYGKKPRVLPQDLVIYEVHPRGFTRHPSSQRLTRIVGHLPGFEGVENVPRQYRGTYKGATYLAKYLRALGVNAVEFMPVHECANALCPDGAPEVDRAPTDPPHGTYWGYMTYGYFAPDRRYAFDQSPGGPTREFKQMVQAFHDEGILVLLDVVYNHSGEGGVWHGDPESAELLFLRGLDNAEYYALAGDGNRFYFETTGCGNNLNAGSPVVERLVLDSIRYWSEEMGVDGFRFDLATVLGREASDGFAFNGNARLLTELETLADANQFLLIAEAWDTATYQVGAFPSGWAEWNGIYRDAVRRFLRGDEASVFAFVDAVNGDYAHFYDSRGPQKSINFVTVHDGFTLIDLVSYDEKNNCDSWPFGPSDGGADQNHSWDSGGNQARRRERSRSFLSVLLFSRGVPMLRGGDEFAQTYNGNNNPYKIDSVATWHNYAAIASHEPNRIPTEGLGAYHDNYGRDRSEEGHNGLFSFTRRLLKLRRDHVALRQAKFADFQMDAGGDVTYLFKKEDGVSHLEGWEKCVSLRIDGSAVGDMDFWVCVNMHAGQVEFTVPRAGSCRVWKRVLDTADWAEPHANFFDVAAGPVFSAGDRYVVHPYTVVAFQEV